MIGLEVFTLLDDIGLSLGMNVMIHTTDIGNNCKIKQIVTQINYYGIELMSLYTFKVKSCTL